jgi:hypothetical protein
MNWLRTILFLINIFNFIPLYRKNNSLSALTTGSVFSSLVTLESETYSNTTNSGVEGSGKELTGGAMGVTGTLFFTSLGAGTGWSLTHGLRLTL